MIVPGELLKGHRGGSEGLVHGVIMGAISFDLSAAYSDTTPAIRQHAVVAEEGLLNKYPRGLLCAVDLG